MQVHRDAPSINALKQSVRRPTFLRTATSVQSHQAAALDADGTVDAAADHSLPRSMRPSAKSVIGNKSDVGKKHRT